MVQFFLNPGSCQTICTLLNHISTVGKWFMCLKQRCFNNACLGLGFCCKPFQARAMGFLPSQILVCKVLATSKDFTDLCCGRIRENTVCILPTTKFMYAGHIYSINDGRYFDWPPGLQHYVDTIRQGRGQNPRRYSARYIASLTADLHRTILYGGIAMNPRSQLQLVHEANSLSFLVEQGGGRAIDGRRRILEIQPTHLHQRLSLFLGSRADVSELEAYGDVQQVINIHPEYDDDDELWPPVTTKVCAFSF